MAQYDVFILLPNWKISISNWKKTDKSLNWLVYAFWRRELNPHYAKGILSSMSTYSTTSAACGISSYFLCVVILARLSFSWFFKLNSMINILLRDDGIANSGLPWRVSTGDLGKERQKLLEVLEGKSPFVERPPDLHFAAGLVREKALCRALERPLQLLKRYRQFSLQRKVKRFNLQGLFIKETRAWPASAVEKGWIKLKKEEQIDRRGVSLRAATNLHHYLCNINIHRWAIA